MRLMRVFYNDLAVAVCMHTCRYNRSPPCWYRLHSVGGTAGAAAGKQQTSTFATAGGYSLGLAADPPVL
jgi:hypothetical protein